MTGVIVVTGREKGIAAVTGVKPLSLHVMGAKTLVSHQISALVEAGAKRVAVISETDKGIRKEILDNKNAKMLSFLSSGKYGAQEFLFEFFESAVCDENEDVVIVSSCCCIEAEDITGMLEAKRELFADGMVLLRESNEPCEPIFSLSSLCKIEGVFIPPSVDYSYSDFTYGGAAVISADVMKKSVKKSVKSLELDFLPEAAANFSVFGHLAERKIIKIQSVSDYKEAVKYYNEKNGGKGIMQIGKNFKRGKECEINDSVICDNVTVGDGTVIKGSIILDDAEIGKGARVEEAIIGAYAEIADGAVIGKKAVIADFKALGKKENENGLLGERAHEAGKRIGRAAKRVMVGISEDDEAEKAAELFISGALLSGADVMTLRGLPRSVWRFAASRYGCDSGAFFQKEGVVFCDTLGYDSFPKAIAEGENKVFGRKIELLGVKELYGEELSLISEKGFTANISSENLLLTEIYCKKVINCTEDEYISFFVNDGGDAFSLTDERGVYLSEEHTAVLSAFAALLVYEKLYLPENYPLADKIIENATGGRIVRVAKENKKDMRKATAFLDAAFCISVIAKAVKKTKKPLFELVAAMPRCVRRSVTLSLSQSRRALVRLYSTEAASEIKTAVPTFFQTEKGGIFVSESTSLPEITVTAVAESESDCEAILRQFNV